MGRKKQTRPKAPETIEDFMSRIETEMDAIGGKLTEAIHLLRDADAMLTDLDLMRGNFHSLLRGQAKQKGGAK